MADKKLNDLTTASDGAYIYAETSAGVQVKISKADLASVVAGQIGIAVSITNITLEAGQSGSIPAGQSIGLALVRNTYQTVDYEVVVFSSSTQASVIVKIEQNNINYGSSISGKICIYRESHGEALTITNNSGMRAVLSFKFIR